MTTGPALSTNDSAAQKRAYYVGVALLFAAAGLWSLNGGLIKLTHDEGRGPHGVTIAFYRSLIAGLFLVPLARGKFHTLLRRRDVPGNDPRGSPPSDGGENRVRVGAAARRTGRGRAIITAILSLRPAAVSCVVFFALMTLCFVVATTKTEAASAIILQYTSTFWIFGLSPLVLQERPRTQDLRLLALAMLGIVVIFLGKASTDLLGLVIALGAGLFYGLETLMIRRLRDADPAAAMVACNLGSALLLLPLVLILAHLNVSMRSALLLLLLGVVQFGLPYYFYARGLVNVPAYQASMITLAEPVLVPVWAYLIVRDVAPVTTIFGGVMILMSLLLFVRSARKGNTTLPAASVNEV